MNSAQPTTARFGDLPEGTQFTFQGKRYTKIGLSMCEDDRHWGTIFLDETIVQLESRQTPDSSGLSENPS